MRTDTVLVRYAEIGLKGQNRPIFENTLVGNIKACLRFHNIGYSYVNRAYGRILVGTADPKAVAHIKEVFGIMSISHATRIELDMDKIKDTSLELAKESGVGKNSFRISSKRLTKTIPFDSLELNKAVGEVIFETLNAKVDLKNPDVNIGIELIDDSAYVFAQTIEGFGGLPLGTESTVLALIEDEKSILAAWLMMKRGAPVIAVGHEQKDISSLEKYAHREIEFIKTSDLSELDAIAEQRRILALCVGQTIKNFKEFATNMIVFRPLLTYSDNEMRELSEKIKS